MLGNWRDRQTDRQTAFIKVNYLSHAQTQIQDLDACLNPRNNASSLVQTEFSGTVEVNRDVWEVGIRWPAGKSVP